MKFSQYSSLYFDHQKQQGRSITWKVAQSEAANLYKTFKAEDLPLFHDQPCEFPFETLANENGTTCARIVGTNRAINLLKKTNKYGKNSKKNVQFVNANETVQNETQEQTNTQFDNKEPDAPESVDSDSNLILTNIKDVTPPHSTKIIDQPPTITSDISPIKKQSTMNKVVQYVGSFFVKRNNEENTDIHVDATPEEIEAGLNEADTDIVIDVMTDQIDEKEKKYDNEKKSNKRHGKNKKQNKQTSSLESRMQDGANPNPNETIESSTESSAQINYAQELVSKHIVDYIKSHENQDKHLETLVQILDTRQRMANTLIADIRNKQKSKYKQDEAIYTKLLQTKSQELTNGQQEVINKFGRLCDNMMNKLANLEEQLQSIQSNTINSANSPNMKDWDTKLNELSDLTKYFGTEQADQMDNIMQIFTNQHKYLESEFQTLQSKLDKTKNKTHFQRNSILESPVLQAQIGTDDHSHLYDRDAEDESDSDDDDLDTTHSSVFQNDDNESDNTSYFINDPSRYSHDDDDLSENMMFDENIFDEGKPVQSSIKDSTRQLKQIRENHREKLAALVL